MPIRYLPFVFIAVLSVGCANSDIEPTNNNTDDVGFNSINSRTDQGDDADMGQDAEPDAEFDMLPKPENFEVIADRSRNTIVLRGTILGPTGAFEGEVAISPPLISCVAADCSSVMGYDDATIIETGGVISPGLIDSHNHLAYNFLPEWPTTPTWNNRYEWADDPSYEAHVEPFANNRSSGSHVCPASRWGELRSLISGTTTMMGQSPNQSCVQGTVRNADHTHSLQYDHMRTTIASVRDINDLTAQGFIEDFTAQTDPTTRFAVHMAEGLTGDNIELEFSSFAGRDTRNNRHQGVSLLYDDTSVLIHSLALTEEELGEARDANAKIVWSPSSNFALYGQTADIDKILEFGITTGLGPDWTPSGEDNLLGEMRYALDYAQQTGISAVTPQRLWQMTTSDGADVVGLDDYIGTLEVGKVADIAVFESLDEDPYLSITKANAPNVLLVFINGESLYGESSARVAVGRDEFCEVIDICGRGKFMCVADPNTTNAFKNYTETRQELVDIMEGNGFPPEEQYGRGDELLELWTCD